VSAFLTSLASIGSEYGQAKIDKSQEDFARQEKQKQVDTQQAYLDLAKKSEARQQAEFEQRKKAGDLIEFKDGRIWSVSKGGFVDQQKTDPAKVFKDFFATLDPRVQKIVGPKAQVAAEEYPYDQKEMMKAVMAETDKAQSQVEKEDAAALTEKNRREDAATAESNRKADAATRHKEHEEDLAVARENQRQLIDLRLSEKYKFLNPQERRLLTSARQMEPMVKKLEDLIDGAGLKESDAAIMDKNSAVMQHLRMYGYKAGVKPDQLHADLIKTAAALQVMGAAPWMQMSRSKYMYETVKQHLPSPTDTPALLYDKAQFLHGIITDLKESLAEAGTPYGAAPGAQEGGGNAPPPGAVIHDFSH
jgi:hypothetical protein